MSSKAIEKRKSFHDLVVEVSAIGAKLMETGGEMDTSLEALYDEVHLALRGKVDAYAFLMKKLESDAALIKADASERMDAAKSILNARDRLKEAIKEGMRRLGVTEIEGEYDRFTLSNSAPALVIAEKDLDPGYLVAETKYVPDKERIKAELKAGKTVKGAMLVTSNTLRPGVSKRST